MKLLKPIVFDFLALCVMAWASWKLSGTSRAGEVMGDALAGLATVLGVMILAPLLSRLGHIVNKTRPASASPPSKNS